MLRSAFGFFPRAATGIRRNHAVSVSYTHLDVYKRQILESLPEWNAEAIHAALFAEIEKLGVKNGWLLYPLRVAVSGKQFTPGGGIELAVVLGREETLRRIRTALEKLG